MTILLLSACNPWKHEHMRQQLAGLQAMNQADSLLTDLTLAQRLADWFDGHGTANEQLLAYYLLGRTHADRGEAPAAIAAYLDAAERADTTAGDCDFTQLAKVYGQMAGVFYEQNLMEDNLFYLDKSVLYATKANDSLVMLNSYARKMAAYSRLRMPDSVVSVCENVYERFYRGSYRQMASRFFGLATDSYLLTGKTDRAKKLLETYESESGYFDEAHNIEKGREPFYKLKGKYYMAVGMYDSAEVCFRKELTFGKSFNDQNMASKGLARLYQRLQMPDSALKYATYAYDMNDSFYAQMATSEIAKAQEMYNYSRFQHLAMREKEQSERLERRSWVLCTFLVLVVAVGLIVWRDQRKKKKANETKFQETLKTLHTRQKELKALQGQVAAYSQTIDDKESTIWQQSDMMQKLREHADELARLETAKEAEIEQLKAELNGLHADKQSKHLDVEIAKMLLEDAPAYQKLQKAIQPLADAEWMELEELAADILKDFYAFISSTRAALNPKERHLCILFRMGVKPKEASNLMNVSPSAITKTSKAIMKKLFLTDGITKDLIERIRLMC